MTSPVLTVENLTKVFYAKKRFFFFAPPIAPFTAVKSLNFHLKEGEILGILGPNGAGKTTLIEMLLGALKPTSGKVAYFGQTFTPHKKELLQHITHASAYHKLPSSLTVQENLEIIGGLYSLSRAALLQRIDTLLSQFDMEAFRYRQTGKLSAGQMTRILLIKAFLPEPKIILLDEPTASLDPDIAKESREYLLKQQKERKVSIIITSHNMQEVTHICDRVLVMQKGSIIQEDTPEMLAKSVALTKLTLTLTHNVDRFLPLVMGKFPFTLTDNTATFEIDEAKIPPLLKIIQAHDIEYSHIDIQKPTLEDFFIHISKQQKEGL